MDGYTGRSSESVEDLRYDADRQISNDERCRPHRGWHDLRAVETNV